MGLFDAILKRFSNRDIDWDDLEELLIGADLGVPLSMEILKHLRDLGRTLKTEDVLTECRRRVLTVLPENRGTALPPLENGQPRVILVAGVNGTGKTTSIAKLAHLLNREGHKVVLAAADTFRAAAIEQLDHWATKIGVPLIKTQYQGDPSAVCYDAYEAASKRGATHLICDTAGRLHVRANLMEELKKIERTLGKKDPNAPHDRLIVVDATTGSNALAQAREFNSALNLTGLILTKLDGSGKGGMAVAIQHQLGIPTLFLGTGERAEDFQRFDRNRFVEELL
jgi:fused signal recognition particle receptor